MDLRSLRCEDSSLPCKIQAAFCFRATRRTPFHTRVQPEQNFDDALHLRCVVRGSCCTDVELLSFRDLRWTTGLNHRLVPTARTFCHGCETPSSAFLCSRLVPGRSICVNVQCKGRNITEPQLLTKRAAAPIQLRAHCVAECAVTVAFPSNRFPDVSFSRAFPWRSLVVTVSPSDPMK